MNVVRLVTRYRSIVKLVENVMKMIEEKMHEEEMGFSRVHVHGEMQVVHGNVQQNTLLNIASRMLAQQETTSSESSADSEGLGHVGNLQTCKTMIACAL